jgi:hypothetical protein
MPPVAALPRPHAALHDGACATGDTTTEETAKAPESQQDANAADVAREADARIAHLVQYLIACGNPDDVTGEMVGPLLNTDLAPRTGRRLLAAARAHLSQEQRADSPTWKISSPA